MSYFAGIDIGSTTTELVVLDDKSDIISYQKELTYGNIQQSISAVLEKSSEDTKTDFKDYEMLVSTGYGRKHVESAHKMVTEITCYAKGAHYLDPKIRTIIDIGGQDSKAISIDENGTVPRFLMNDKCAAGTGRFLEMVAKIFNIDINQLGELSLQSTDRVKISNVCAVFAESEIISLFSQGISKQNIINSVHMAVCERVYSMVKRVQIKEKVMFCGGVANNVGILKAFEELLQVEVTRPKDVFMVGALGAALIGRSEYQKKVA